MRSFVLALLMVPLAALAAIAQAPHGPGPNGPRPGQVDRHDVARRGNDVQEVNGLQAGGVDEVIRAALAPPPDDTAKWEFCLLIQSSPASDPVTKACEQLKQDFSSSPALADLVNVADPKTSWARWQVRNIDDQTQRDWLAKVRPAIDRSKLPCLIIQPWYNGKMGPRSNVVAMINSYPGSASQYHDAVLTKIIDYVRVQYAKGVVTDDVLREAGFDATPVVRTGFNQGIPAGARAANTTFPWPVVPDPFLPTPGVTPAPSQTSLAAFPAFSKPEAAPAGKPVTAAEIKDLIPDVSPEFLLEIFGGGGKVITDIREAVELWRKYKAAKEAVTAVGTGGYVAYAAVALGVLAFGFGLWSHYIRPNIPPDHRLVSDAAFQGFEDAIASLEQKIESLAKPPEKPAA